MRDAGRHLQYRLEHYRLSEAKRKEMAPEPIDAGLPFVAEAAEMLRCVGS